MSYGWRGQREADGYVRAQGSGAAGGPRRMMQRPTVDNRIFTPPMFQRDSGGEETSDDSSDFEYVPPAPGGSRELYMGNTPSKSSPTGQKVIQNMLDLDIHKDKTWLIRDSYGKIYLQTEYAKKEGEYEKIEINSPRLHMGHIYDAVSFWNEIGRFTGPKSACVRAFMMDANNYLIQYGPRNQQLALHTPYLEPVDDPCSDFEYEPCSSVGDQDNFASMKRKLEKRFRH